MPRIKYKRSARVKSKGPKSAATVLDLPREILFLIISYFLSIL